MSSLPYKHQLPPQPPKPTVPKPVPSLQLLHHGLLHDVYLSVRLRVSFMASPHPFAPISSPPHSMFPLLCRRKSHSGHRHLASIYSVPHFLVFLPLFFFFPLPPVSSFLAFEDNLLAFQGNPRKTVVTSQQTLPALLEFVAVPTVDPRSAPCR